MAGRTADSQSLMWRGVAYLFPKNCFEELFMYHNFMHEECVPLVISRFLGLAIVLGSVLVKVPQIVKIWRAGSGVGVSPSAQLLELTAVLATASYSFASAFPFSAWGDSVFLAIQTVAVVALIWYFEGKVVRAWSFVLATAIVAGLLLSPVVPIRLLAVLQAANIPIVIFAKMMQCISNYNNQSTGQLSLVMMIMMFGGALARIFTSIQETGDNLVILIYVVSSIMNGLILAQIFMYWGKHPKKKLL